MKETEKDSNRWKDIPCLWIGRVNMVKMTIISYPSQSTEYNLYQITNGSFHRTKTKKSHLHGDRKELK